MKYWMDKAITEDGRIILEKYFTKEKCDSIPAIYDCGEPECMACGKTSSNIFQNPRYDYLLQTEDKWHEVWDFGETKKLLERAHIVGVQFNGRDSPDNIVLLCKKCHAESPDTPNEKDMLSWIFYKRKYGKNIDIMNKTIEYLSICLKRNLDASTCDCESSIIGFHCGSVSTQTKIYAAANTCKPNGAGEKGNAINKITKDMIRIYSTEKNKLENQLITENFQRDDR